MIQEIHILGIQGPVQALNQLCLLNEQQPKEIVVIFYNYGPNTNWIHIIRNLIKNYFLNINVTFIDLGSQDNVIMALKMLLLLSRKYKYMKIYISRAFPDGVSKLLDTFAHDLTISGDTLGMIETKSDFEGKLGKKYKVIATIKKLITRRSNYKYDAILLTNRAGNLLEKPKIERLFTLRNFLNLIAMEVAVADNLVILPNLSASGVCSEDVEAEIISDFISAKLIKCQKVQLKFHPRTPKHRLNKIIKIFELNQIKYDLLCSDLPAECLVNSRTCVYSILSTSTPNYFLLGCQKVHQFLNEDNYRNYRFSDHMAVKSELDFIANLSQSIKNAQISH